MSKRSQTLSLLLRHKPHILEFNMDKECWLPLQQIIERSNIFDTGAYTLEEIKNIVKTSDKQRFSISDDGLYIRCNQGHSKHLNISINYKKQIPKDYLFHGTAESNLSSIMKKGLQPMTRQFVHLSDNLDTSISVGKRYAKNNNLLILQIDVFNMVKEGYDFYLSENNVWLIKEVPAKFLSIIDLSPQTTKKMKM